MARSTPAIQKWEPALDELSKLLKDFAKRHGKNLRKINYVVIADGFGVKVSIEIVDGADESGNKHPLFRAAFLRNASLMKLDPKDLDTSFEAGGKKLKIIGCDVKARSNPVVLEDTTGRLYKATPEQVKLWLKRR